MTQQRRHNPGAVLTRSACAAIALSAGAATAQTGPYYIGASQSIGHETNLLRLADNQAAPAGQSKSDTVSVTSLLAGLDQPIGRQRVYADATLRAIRYADNQRYDNEGYTLRGGLDWSTVNRLSGTVVAAANRSLASLNTSEIGLLGRKNLETTKSLDATARLGGVTRLTFEAGAGYRQVDNSLDDPRVRSLDYDVTSASLGVRYWPTGATYIGVGLRGAEGEYPTVLQRTPTGDTFRSDRYSQRGIELSGAIEPSGVSSFDARIVYGSTEYDIAQRRDFTGITGAASWIWKPTGKLRFTSRLSRDTGQDASAFEFLNVAGLTDASRVVTSALVRADYDFSAKVAFSASVLLSDRDLVRTTELLATTGSVSGRDRVSLLTLGARWAPTRTVLVGCDIAAEKSRGSGALGTDLTAERYSCYGQITLRP